MFAKRLKQLREQNKLTQKELAEKLGITSSALSLYELGKREPDNDTLGTIADYFQVTSDYLLGRSNDPKPRELPDTVAPYLPEGFDKLSPEARKEVLDFIDYIMVKYGKK